jgi:uncharacterized membrane protein (DUF485 family)
MDNVILFIFGVAVFITAGVFTKMYMKDKIMIHNGVEGQIDGYGKIFVTMLIPAGFLWMVVAYIFSGIFRFIANHFDWICLAVAAYALYSFVTHKDEDSNNDEAPKE